MVVAEINNGQLVRELRAAFGRPLASYTRTRGLPLDSAELAAHLLDHPTARQEQP